MNEQGKRDMIAAFTELGLPYTPSYANFMWVDTKKDAKAVNQALLKKGIIIRVSDSFRAPTHLRVTIGTQEENQAVLGRPARCVARTVKDGYLIVEVDSMPNVRSFIQSV